LSSRTEIVFKTVGPFVIN